MFIPTVDAASFVSEDTVMVDNLFSTTKPQCVGVYLLNVPDVFENRIQQATYDDFKIESQFIYPPAFKQRIALREQELIAAINKPENEPKDAPFIKEIIRLPNNQGVIFDRNQNGSDDAYRTLEAHIYTNHIAFIITINILDLSAPKYREEKENYLNSGFSAFKLNDKSTKLAALYSLISRLNGRLNHEIPKDKGVCIPNGFIADDGEKHKIVIGFSYQNDDFILAINTDNSLLADGDTLFGRSDDINEALKESKMKTVKKYASRTNDIPFEAWLWQGTQNYQHNLLQVYDFTLYANEAVATTFKPLVTIALDSQYKQTRYSEQQMIDIWDRIVNSLRYKPNAF